MRRREFLLSATVTSTGVIVFRSTKSVSAADEVKEQVFVAASKDSPIIAAVQAQDNSFVQFLKNPLNSSLVKYVLVPDDSYGQLLLTFDENGKLAEIKDLDGQFSAVLFCDVVYKSCSMLVTDKGIRYRIPLEGKDAAKYFSIVQNIQDNTSTSPTQKQYSLNEPNTIFFNIKKCNLPCESATVIVRIYPSDIAIAKKGVGTLLGVSEMIEVGRYKVTIPLLDITQNIPKADALATKEAINTLRTLCNNSQAEVFAADALVERIIKKGSSIVWDRLKSTLRYINIACGIQSVADKYSPISLEEHLNAQQKVSPNIVTISVLSEGKRLYTETLPFDSNFPREFNYNLTDEPNIEKILINDKPVPTAGHITYLPLGATFTATVKVSCPDKVAVRFTLEHLDNVPEPTITEYTLSASQDGFAYASISYTDSSYETVESYIKIELFRDGELKASDLRQVIFTGYPIPVPGPTPQ